MTLLLHYRPVSSGDLSLLFLTLLAVVGWQCLELGKRIRLFLNIVYFNYGYRINAFKMTMVRPFAASVQ